MDLIYDELPWTGINENLGGGILRGSLIALGGRPSMGKTLLLINMAAYWVFEKKLKVLLFTRDNKQFLLSGLEYLAKNVYNITESLQIHDNFQDLPASPEKPNIWITNQVDILNWRDYDKEQFRFDIILIDGLQLMRRQFGDIHQQMVEIVNDLKRYVSITGSTVVVTSAVQKKVEERHGHLPMMHDFRDSGFLEEVADQVWTVLRREYYDPMDKPGQIRFSVIKNNHGKSFVYDMIHQPESEYSEEKRSHVTECPRQYISSLNSPD